MPLTTGSEDAHGVTAPTHRGTPSARVVRALCRCHQGLFPILRVDVTFWRCPASIWCDHDGSDRSFDAERPRLTAIAIRILGSEADADDVLQEAWLRLSRTDAIDDLPAWLTTVVTRLVP